MASFISVLKNIGLTANKIGGQIFPQWAPVAQIIAAATPTKKDDEIVAAVITTSLDKLHMIQDAVLTVERLTTAVTTTNIDGPTRAAMIAPEVDAILQTMPVIGGRKPKDPEQTRKDALEVGAAVAKYLNGFEA